MFIVAVILSILSFLFGGAIASSLTSGISDNIFFSQTIFWYIVRASCFGGIFALLVYTKLRTVCPHCGATFVETHLSTDSCLEDVFEKVEHETINGKNKKVVNTYKVYKMTGNYKCDKCGEKYTKTWRKNEKVKRH